METKTYLIPEGNWEALTSRLEKLTRRAKKLGRQTPTINIIAERDEVDNKGRVARFFEISINSEPIAVNGWTFVASIDISDDPEVGRVINRVPGVLTDTDLPVEYRSATDYCEHCQMNRRRNTVFILFNDAEGIWKQVGRNCLGQFLGGIDPENVVRSMEMLIDFDAICSGYYGSAACERLDLQSALSLTGFVIKNHGWMSRSKARERRENGELGVFATADIIEDMYFKPERDWSSTIKNLVFDWECLIKNPQDSEKVEATPGSKVCYDIQAEEAIAWIRGQNVDDLNDYLYNLFTVCKSETFLKKHLGIAVSLLIAYQNSIGRLEKLKEDAEKKKALQHVGVIGKRETMELKVRDIKYWNNNFGVTTAVFFEDSSGNRLIWKASRDPELDKDNFYQITGKIKAHSEYNGTKQTELSHCKVLAAIPRPV